MGNRDREAGAAAPHASDRAVTAEAAAARDDRGRLGALAIFGAVASLASLPSLGLVAGALHGHLAWEAWAHEIDCHFCWVGYIQPPLFPETLHAFERLGAWLGVDRAVVLSVVAAGGTGVVAAGLFLATLRLGFGAAWAALAAALLAISPAAMRPHEQYPVAKLFCGLALLGFVALLRQPADRRPSRVSVLFLAASSLLAIETHLSAGFLLAPCFGLLLLRRPELRRSLSHVIALVAAGFLLSTLSGFWGTLLHGPGYAPGQPPQSGWRIVTWERNNPFLLLPALLWLVPAVRRGGRTPAALGPAVFAGVALLLLVTWTLQYLGLAIGGDFRGCHHYFELADPAFAAIATWALADAWTAAGQRAVRWLLPLAAAALLLLQWLLWQRSLRMMEELAVQHVGPGETGLLGPAW
jgi:hypothetical protein